VTTTPEFSIILPTYGRPAFLAEAIQSVLAQTVEDFELIVVDDASTEPARIPTGDARIRLLRREVNGGPAAARNTGLAAATGKYVAFIDDDDLYDPHRLQMARDGLLKAPIALCWYNYIGESPHGRRLDADVADQLLAGLVPHLGATAVTSSIVVPFDESYLGAEDVEWWIRMADIPVATVPEVGYRLRRHTEVRINHGTQGRLQGSRRMLDAHADFFDAHPDAAAFRWKRIGLMASSMGDRWQALSAFAKSFRLRPAGKTLGHALYAVFSRR